MNQISCPVIFMRGGTSKGLFFHAGDLPSDRAEREAFLLGAIGSPDPSGRQLDGMGGGISSLSKAMIIARSSREGIDVEYNFCQISVDRPTIDYMGNCGNLTSAVAVFAIDSGLVSRPDGEALVRLFNLNTSKTVDCTLRVAGGKAVVSGDFAIAGVAGTGSPIRLNFLEPGGAGTGRLLPTGAPVDQLELPDGSRIAASIVDAANLCVFVRAADLGCTGTELPTKLRNNVALLARFEAIRAAAAVAAGISTSARDATHNSPGIPKIAMVAPAVDAPTLSGEVLRAAECDVQVRMISMELPHLAVPLTGAMCTGVAAQIEGTLVHECARRPAGGQSLRVGHGSGALPITASVSRRDGAWFADSVSVTRTARVLMEGRVYAPPRVSEPAE